MSARRLGLFGGTFDPVHHGHLIVAADAFESLQLDLLVFIPAAQPPHRARGVVATAEQRLEMVRAAVAGDPRFAVDDIELRREGPSYTVDTLREIARREPDAELHFLLGIDQFRALHSWREPEEVARLAKLCVLARGGETASLEGPYGGVHAPVTRVDISATRIRSIAAEGGSIRYLVPDAVRERIERERIYEL
jgi:nicotinate-nucleotide adenylyltransferase